MKLGLKHRTARPPYTLSFELVPPGIWDAVLDTC